MSTPGNPSGESPLTNDADTSVGVQDPHEHHWFSEPTKEVGPKYVAALVFAQLIFFIALLGPATIGMAVKVQTIVPPEQKASAAGLVFSVGALFAVIGNVLFGRLSDRTTARWGRRRPWIVAGTIVMTGAFLLIALAPTVPLVVVGWCLAQLGANATFAPFVATIADQVPRFQRGSVSALLGIAQNIGVLGGAFLAQLFAKQMVILFVVPSIFAIGAMVLFAFVLPDQHMKVKPPRMNRQEWLGTLGSTPAGIPTSPSPGGPGS